MLFRDQISKLKDKFSLEEVRDSFWPDVEKMYKHLSHLSSSAAQVSLILVVLFHVSRKEKRLHLCLHT